MRHMRKHLTIFLAVISFSASAFAEYAVQIGAFGKPSQAFADSARALGEVNTAQTDAGITVFTIGRYASVDAAQADLARHSRKLPQMLLYAICLAAHSGHKTYRKRVAIKRLRAAAESNPR